MANGHGGKRPGAGRPPGSRSAAAKEHYATIAELARSYTDVAINALVSVAKEGSDSARVAAANSLLDRAYGRPLTMAEMAEMDGDGETTSLTINIRAAPAIGDVRVTRSDS
jgi:hypothetical protein